MEKTDTDILKRMRRGRKVVVDKKTIMAFLPHRGRMLLLDRVIITSQAATGEFLVTEDVCKGHAVSGDKLVFRGVDIGEMAAQLLGIVWGIQHPDFTNRVGLLREIGKLKFSGGPVFVGDLLTVELDRGNITERILGGPEQDRMIIALAARGFLARVKKGRKATIESIKLVIGSLEA